ncbi:WD40-repeat-containing domain protein [Mycena crocata]|nr:WD40-repeat-containing domain protein [Mycena crocata]
MLALTTTQQLSIVDPQSLRRPPSSLPSCLSLLAPCTASAWSPDNLSLFLSSPSGIHQYNPTFNTLSDIYSSPEPIAHLVCKTKSSLAFATGDKIHILESTKVVQTFDSHKAPITSLALSNDLLASTSAGAAHVHNLLLGSHTALRGLNLAGQRITTCAFHPHSRARLLLGVGKQLLVYDTTRPSGPVKTIPMNDTSTGDIVSVACSPFSKTLVAVASANGSVGLVDLDKDKALFRTLSLKVPLTSIAFSPEGASIYLGTEHGKLLIMDLRALDKPPKTVALSESGCRVQTMAVQKKTKGGDTDTKPTTATTKASGPIDASNPARRPSVAVAAPAARSVPKTVSPSKGRIARIGSGTSPVRRPSTLSAVSPRVPSNANPKIFSPVRDPRGNSASIDEISTRSNPKKQGKAVTPADDKKTAKLSTTQPTSSKIDNASAGPTLSRLSATSRIRKTSITESVSTAAVGHDIRPRTASAASRVTSAKAASSRTGPSGSRPGSSASQRSPAPPVPALPAGFAARSDMPASRTPSPELPSLTGEPVTPLPSAKRVAALGTPEVNRWIEAGEIRPNRNGKGKGKTVNFQDGNDENLPQNDDKERERERSLSMQVSPRRPSSSGLGNSASWAPSPLRNAVPTSPTGGGSSAHDLLRSIVRDVMFDFQQEQRSEMVGLHLDLLKIGRGWKKELRELMDEYVGDLREENKRLREENEHLRRGY